MTHRGFYLRASFARILLFQSNEFLLLHRNHTPRVMLPPFGTPDRSLHIRAVFRLTTKALCKRTRISSFRVKMCWAAASYHSFYTTVENSYWNCGKPRSTLSVTQLSLLKIYHASASVPTFLQLPLPQFQQVFPQPLRGLMQKLWKASTAQRIFTGSITNEPGWWWDSNKPKRGGISLSAESDLFN